MTQHRPERARPAAAGPRPPARLLPAMLTLLLLGGCLYTPGPTEAYPVESAVVETAWRRMTEQPTGLTRPLVVLDGWFMTGGGGAIAREMKRLTGADDADVLLETFSIGGVPEPLAARVVRHVEAEWPSDDPHWTIEVDVIGFSIGGVYARLAGLPPPEGYPDRKRLRIRRLFTVSSPHRGTIGIAALAPDASSRAVRPGSELLGYLDAAQPDAPYELVCYAQLNDEIVGARNAAPPGHEPIWTQGPWLGHLASSNNKRILVDMALRLRGETPLAGTPSRPPKN